MTTVISVITIGNGDSSLYSTLRYDVYEMLCQRMEQDGHFLEAQALHYNLLEIYQIQSNEEMMEYHLRSGLRIAMEHGFNNVKLRNSLYWKTVFSVVGIPYIPDSNTTDGVNLTVLARTSLAFCIQVLLLSCYYPKILADFPKDFSESIQAFGTIMREKYVLFISMSHKEKYDINLSNNDFVLVTYTVQGYSNKEIASAMKISEKSVSRRYNNIYEKLGVQNKHELVGLINSTTKA